MIFKLLIAVGIAFGLSGCGFESTPLTEKQIQAQNAAVAANSVHFKENAEIQNIKKRLELTANPGLLGYVILLNDMGQPVMYTGVKGKITSGGKRLTPEEESHFNGHSTYSQKTASDEGTYGHSGDYIYFWTTNGQYIQWNGHYLYSDKPFRLSSKPLVIDITDK